MTQSGNMETRFSCSTWNSPLFLYLFLICISGLSLPLGRCPRLTVFMFLHINRFFIQQLPIQAYSLQHRWHKLLFSFSTKPSLFNKMIGVQSYTPIVLALGSSASRTLLQVHKHWWYGTGQVQPAAPTLRYCRDHQWQRRHAVGDRPRWGHSRSVPGA